MQLPRRDTERRAAFVVIEEEESREQPARAHQLGDARAPARPFTPWQRAKKRALVYELERRFREREEIRLPYRVRELAQRAARRRYGGVGEIDAEHIVAVLGKGAHLVAGPAAGHEHASPAGFLGQPAREDLRHAARVPRRDAVAIARVPEFGPRRVRSQAG